MSVYSRCSLPEPLQDKDSEAVARLFRPQQAADPEAAPSAQAIKIEAINEVLRLLDEIYDGAAENLDARYDSRDAVLRGIGCAQEAVADHLVELGAKSE